MGKYIKILSKYQGVIVLLMSKNEIDRCFSGWGLNVVFVCFNSKRRYNKSSSSFYPRKSVASVPHLLGSCLIKLNSTKRTRMQRVKQIIPKFQP